MKAAAVAWTSALAVLVCAASPGAQQAPKFSSGTLVVRIDALVTDNHHNPVAGLTASDFELRDDGVPQQIHIETSQAPISVVLTLDTSLSIAGARQKHLVDASLALLDGLHPGERASLATFSDVVTAADPPSDDLSLIRQRLQHIVPQGDTSILDGTYVALMSTLAESGRSLVVVCTDGTDTFSWLEPDEVEEAAKRSNAVIYAVTAASIKRHSPLQELAEQTGGRVLPVVSSADLHDAFQKILTEFRTRYVLAFTPDGVPAGGFHRIDVRTIRDLHVKARNGYLGIGAAGSL
jgi:VWFA-related protein